MKLYTIGHSNQTFKEFVTTLQMQGVTHIVDVRTMPRSRHVPWTNKENLKSALGKKNIGYTHLPILGGLRHTNKNSNNIGWRNKSFRGFADYMQTKEFYIGLKLLMTTLKKKKRVAIMCAEALPWQCHRSLISDALTIRNISVHHIMNKNSVRDHTLTSFAKINRQKRPIELYYPDPNLKLDL